MLIHVECDYRVIYHILRVLCLCVHCILCTVYCVLYTVYFILCTVYCVLYTVYCILCTVYCVLYTVYCILCTVYCILCTIYCVLYTVYCTLPDSGGWSPRHILVINGLCLYVYCACKCWLKRKEEVSIYAARSVQRAVDNHFTTPNQQQAQCPSWNIYILL